MTWDFFFETALPSQLSLVLLVKSNGKIGVHNTAHSVGTFCDSCNSYSRKFVPSLQKALPINPLELDASRQTMGTLLSKKFSKHRNFFLFCSTRILNSWTFHESFVQAIEGRVHNH
jgi:hypothetical protein